MREMPLAAPRSKTAGEIGCFAWKTDGAQAVRRRPNVSVALRRPLSECKVVINMAGVSIHADTRTPFRKPKQEEGSL